MDEYTIIKTKQFRGCGFMTVCKYNNKGDIIYIGDKDSKLITVIDTLNYNIIGTLTGHNGVVWSLDISKDDNILVSASGDLTIGFFNAKNGDNIYQTSERCIPKYVCTQKNTPTTNKNLVAIICEALTKKSSTYISIYNLDKIEDEDFLEPIKLIWVKQSKPTVMIWNGDDELFICTDNGTIIKRNIDDLNGEYEKEYSLHSGSIKSIVWNKTFSQILTGSLDCTALNSDPNNEFKIIATYKSSVPINYAIWNHNNRKVFLGGGIDAMNVAKTSDNDLNLKIYRTNDQKLTHHIGSHFGPIRFIDKDPNSKNYMTASQDGSVKIYLINDDDSNNKSIDNEQNNIDNDNFDRLIDETNKMINLNWKPLKVKEVVDQKWIPGMPIPKNKNKDNGIYELDNSSSNFDEKLNELKKKEEEQNSTIRITNLPKDITPKQLYDLFDLYGRIEERGVRIKYYPDNTMAFIKYIFSEAASKAIENMDGYVIDYMIINVEMAKQR